MLRLFRLPVVIAMRSIGDIVYGRICLSIIVCLFLPQIVHARYLQSETLTLPTDGRAVRTTIPLNPAHQYHVTVTSSYNLRAFLVACSHYDNVSRSFFGLIEEHDRFTLCKPPLLFDGNQLRTSRWQRDDRGSYYLQNSETEFYIPSLHFYFWGTGSPLTIRTATDLSHKVRTASVKIVDFTWEKQQRREAEQREKERQEILLRQQVAAQRAEEQARERRRQQLERERIDRAHEMRLAEMQEQARLASRIRTVVIAGALLFFILFLWWLIATSDRRRTARLEQQRLAREAQEAAEASAARARAQEAEAERRAEVLRRRQQQAQRERQHEAAEAKRRREVELLETTRHTRFRAIQVRYGDQLFAWRNDEAALARYAKEHRSELLSPSREQEIIDDYISFTNDDLDFTEWLRVNHGELYHRVDEVFFYRVRAIAESTPKDDTPRRPKLTPEERQAKFERYRQRGLERDRIQAEDRMAAVRQKLDLLQQFRDDLDAYDLDEDERERYIKEFEDDLLAQTEEDANGNFKQV